MRHSSRHSTQALHAAPGRYWCMRQTAFLSVSELFHFMFTCSWKYSQIIPFYVLHMLMKYSITCCSVVYESSPQRWQNIAVCSHCHHHWRFSRMLCLPMPQSSTVANRIWMRRSLLLMLWPVWLLRVPHIVISYILRVVCQKRFHRSSHRTNRIACNCMRRPPESYNHMLITWRPLCHGTQKRSIRQRHSSTVPINISWPRRGTLNSFPRL